MWPQILLVTLLVYIFSTRYQKGVKDIPGPFLRSISTLPRVWSAWSGRIHVHDLELHKTYGKVVRVAPRKISIADVRAMDLIYGITTKFYKSDLYEPLRFYDEEGIIPDPFVLTDKALHSRMKRNSANAYSLSSLMAIEPLVDSVIFRLFNTLEDLFVKDSRVCNIGDYLHYFAMDTIFTVTFGEDLGFIQKRYPEGILKKLQSGLRYFITVGQIPWIHRFLLGNSLVSRIFGGNTAFAEQIMLLGIHQSKKFVEKFETSDEAPNTFLHTLLLNQKHNPSSINEREINTHVFGNILAGSDTTSVALRSILTQLLDHPSVTEKLRSELSVANLTANAPIPWKVASELPYLNAVIKESMRIHPSVGHMLSRFVPASGAEILGYRIPAGVEVGINPWIIHRDPDIFPNPEAFDPERWLPGKVDKEHLQLMNRAWFSFGGGAHTCSGRHISMLEIVKLIPALLLNYNMRWDNGAENRKTVNLFFTIQEGLMIVLEKRVVEGLV